MYETDARYTPHDSDVAWTRTIDANQWTIEARIPAKAFYQSSDVIRANTMVVAIVSCLLAFGIAYLFSSRFTSRIRTLKDSMQKVSFGKLDTRTPIEGRDELGDLDMSFNRMVTGVQTLIGEVEQSERLKRGRTARIPLSDQPPSAVQHPEFDPMEGPVARRGGHPPDAVSSDDGAGGKSGYFPRAYYPEQGAPHDRPLSENPGDQARRGVPL